MGVSLIIPAAGQSSRFPGTRPKWLLTHPAGIPMARAAINGLAGDVDNVYLVVLAEHLNEYTDFEHLLREFSGNIQFNGYFHLVVLDEPTRSQPETVYRAIKDRGIAGAIYVKDADNYFTLEVSAGNSVAVVDIGALEVDSPGSKSYALADPSGRVQRIAEKQVISDQMCCGGYGFESAEAFVKVYDLLAEHETAPAYISDVIRTMVRFGAPFQAQPAANYSDWGTLKAWRRFTETFATLLVDIDGTLVRSSGRFVRPFHGETEPIRENVEALRRVAATGRVQIILTTARSRYDARQTYAEMDAAGVPYSQIIFGLPHARRVLINDFAATNAYPSAEAVNIVRDSPTLAAALSRWL